MTGRLILAWDGTHRGQSSYENCSCSSVLGKLLGEQRLAVVEIRGVGRGFSISKYVSWLWDACALTDT